MGGETPQAMIADNGSTLLASINTLNMTQDWQDLVSVNLLELSFYVFLFTIGGSANAYVVYNLAWGKRLTSTRHEKLLLNLAIADAIVTLVMTPTEIAWRITASWKAGNLMCKLFQFYRLFGIYLSSMVLICISIDRLLAVYSPFKYQTYDIFVKKLLIVAWLLSFIFALPQIFIFHVESPSEFPGFTQCVSFKSFQTETQLRMYNIFCLSIIYFVPLLCISLCYTFICVKIRRKMVRRFLTAFRNGDLTTVVNPEVQHSETIGFTSSQLQSAQNCHSPHPHSNANGCDLTTEGATLTRPSSSSAPVAPVTTPSRGSLRCIVLPVSSASRQRQKIGSKIVKDTVIIIAAFIVCWTPYATIHLWYQIDWSSAFQVDKSLQGVLFLFAISNSCVNPYIYGKIFDPTCLLKQ